MTLNQGLNCAKYLSFKENFFSYRASTYTRSFTLFVHCHENNVSFLCFDIFVMMAFNVNRNICMFCVVFGQFSGF